MMPMTSRMSAVGNNQYLSLTKRNRTLRSTTWALLLPADTGERSEPQNYETDG